MDAEHLRDLASRFVRLDGLDGHLRLQAGWGDSCVFEALTLLYHFQCRPPSKEGVLFCPRNGVHYTAYKSNLVDGHPFGALVGRFTSSNPAGGDVFFIGKKATLAGKPAGRLGLAVNDNKHWQNNLGTFWVTMTATDAYDLGDAQ